MSRNSTSLAEESKNVKKEDVSSNESDEDTPVQGALTRRRQERQ